MFRNRKYKTHRATSGQSTVEYIVLVTAVIAGVIFFVAPGKDGGQGVLGNKIVTVMNETAEGFVDQQMVLDGSHKDTVNYTASKVTVDSTKGSLFNDTQPLN